VELAALDDRVVEHLGDGAAQGLGAVEHHQDRPRHLQTTLPQPGQQVADHAGVLGGALGQGERDLGAVQGDPEATTQVCSATRIPSTSSATRSSPVRSWASSSASASWPNRSVAAKPGRSARAAHRCRRRSGPGVGAPAPGGRRGYLAGLGAVADRRPVGVVAAPGADQPGDVLGEQGLQHLDKRTARS
jgi:hypothetical protein